MSTPTLALAPPARKRARRAWVRPRATTIAYILVGLAVLLRLATLAVPHFFFADEIFQYLEPAHRLLFDEGVVTWEQRYHVRTWAFPLALAGPMWLGNAIAPGSAAYLVAPKLALLALSLIGLWAAGTLGRLVSPLHALMALLVGATWFETVYFATQALTEAAAIPLFLAGAALLYRGDRERAAGILLATSALLRFQYAPAIGLFALAVCWSRPRRIVPLAIGATIAVIGLGAIELIMGAIPFGWLIENFYQNIGLQRSHAWVAGPSFYLRAVADLWGVWLVPILGLSLIGARRWPALALCAASNIAVHSLIAHKEYRYILLSTAIVVLLAAFGTADGLRWLERRLPGTRIARLAIAAAGVWLLASASLAFGPEARLWWRQGTPMLQAFNMLRESPRLCGVALYGIDWSASGGYTYLHRAVPLLIYRAGESRMLAREATAFDAIVAPATLAPPAGYGRMACFADVAGAPAICVSRRAGGCGAAGRSHEINALLIRQDR